jgi:hypothetical protein
MDTFQGSFAREGSFSRLAKICIRKVPVAVFLTYANFIPAT